MSAQAHLKRVRSLKCVVCERMGMVQQGKTFANHVESVRDEASDYAVVAVCYDHHQGPLGIHGLSRRGFEMRYRLTDIDLVALTIRQLDREGCIV
jgi:hypothetical protein